MRVFPAVLIPLLLLGACDEKDAPAAAPAPAARQSAARDAATAALRERLRGQQTQLRGVQVFSQALPETVAVCGRSSAGAGDPYIPFVAVVGFQGEAARVTGFTLGATGPEATRVFLEMVDRCFDGGGPLTSRAMARSYPPLPITGASDPIAAPPPTVSSEPAPEPAAPAAASAPPPVQPGSLPASRSTVVTWARTGANLRSSPVGGEVIGVLPPSSTLEVIAEAPGGWYQVGRDGNAIGWVHASVLEAPGH